MEKENIKFEEEVEVRPDKDKKKKRILIVDDTKMMRRKLNQLLNQKYEIVGEAVDGADAIVKYMKLKPDLVTLDIEMPNMDGLEALAELIRIDPDACIVIISGSDNYRMVAKTFSMGAKDCVLKPYKEPALLDSISKALANTNDNSTFKSQIYDSQFVENQNTLKKNVLIVDDSSVMRKILRTMLTPEYKIVGEAVDGLEAIKKFKLLKPDIVTLDYEMPKMNGAEALFEIKKLNPNACVVMMTSVNSFENIKKLIGMGAKGYVLKPYQEDIILSAISQAMVKNTENK